MSRPESIRRSAVRSPSCTSKEKYFVNNLNEQNLDFTSEKNHFIIHYADIYKLCTYTNKYKLVTKRAFSPELGCRNHPDTDPACRTSASSPDRTRGSACLPTRCTGPEETPSLVLWFVDPAMIGGSTPKREQS